MIKQIVTDFRMIPDIATDKETQQAAGVLTKKLMNRWEQFDKAAHEQLQSVKHTLLVETLQ
jgi:hypothetical protein